MAKKRKDHKGRVLRKGEQQRENGTYMYRWTSSEGRRECIYANSLDELRKKEDEINKEISLGVSRTLVTLNEQIEIYLMTKRNLANSTKENYNYYYRHSVKDSRIGKMKVIDIRKSDILLFYHDLEERI